ncbi:hypothetical protein [Thalassobacillus cyri]|uniref:hypothetical protein n=1 Tax=Thalassobacillus cyri TaxID=571932 RepID=UPI000A989F3C|nr:hypothetical protein [Thalassobacillus cyri]
MINKNRTEIIIQEIQYWKINRLLPESYCDYLLALYTKGNGVKNPISFWERMIFYLRLAVITLLFPISFLVIYFTETAFIMQTVILSIFVIGTGLSAVFLHNKQSIDFYITSIVHLLLLLLWNLHLLSLWQTAVWAVVSVVVIHCFFWYWLGKRWEFRLLKFTGFLGSVFALLIMFLNF